MKYVILLLAASLCGCNALNSYESAALNNGNADYAGARANLQKVDDDKLQFWKDSACTLNLGALQRAKDPSEVKAALLACPVANPSNQLTVGFSGGVGPN